MSVRSETAVRIALETSRYGLEFGAFMRRHKADVRVWPHGRGRLEARGAARQSRSWDRDGGTVRTFTVSAPVRLAQTVASAAIVRDVAAFGSVVVFGTMLAVLCGFEPTI